MKDLEVNEITEINNVGSSIRNQYFRVTFDDVAKTGKVVRVALGESYTS